MTRLHNASSKASASHLIQYWQTDWKVIEYHMDRSNNTKAFIHQKLSSRFQVEFGFAIFRNGWVGFLSFGKINITKMKNCSNNSENGFLKKDSIKKQKDRKQWFSILARTKLNPCLWNKYLIFVTYSNNTHSSTGGEILMSIIYISQFIALWLVKVVKRFRIS